MLSSWTIANFKSVGSNTTLDFSPITILVGANSSGKSSIIQSILLIKQTLQYATSDRALALNGPLLKLGNFDDVKNTLTDRDVIDIGWEFDPGRLAQQLPGSRNYEDDSLYWSFSRRDWRSFSFLARFGVDRSHSLTELSLLQPTLESCRLRISPEQTSPELEETIIEIERVREREFATAALGRGQIEVKLGYDVLRVDKTSEYDVLDEYPGGVIRGAAVQNFIPSFLGVAFDAGRRKATQIVDAITNLRLTMRLRQEVGDVELPPEFVAAVMSWLDREGSLDQFALRLREPQASRTVEQMIEVIRGYQRTRGRRAVPMSQEQQTELLEMLLQHFPSEPSIQIEYPHPIAEVENFTRRFFQANVLYLGPLRDEPKPLYPLEALGNPTDVGYRGEHTAAVLDLNRNRRVEYVPSKAFDGPVTPVSCNAARREARCIEAVIDWLSYMGVADDVATVDQGKIGHAMTVKTSGTEKYHDLTNVGVGVSQVLPIVVMALLARPGSVLILEQPELHLHPRVQTRLADFLLSMAFCGKQCIVETHSEYLIHRLRRRIAEAPGDELTGSSRIYAVERDHGQTSIRAVDVSKYGAISSWPRDFFDQSLEEGEAIITAATKKRAADKRS